jgi:hypothetical protein
MNTPQIFRSRLDCLHRDPIQLPDDRRLLQAVGEHLLAIADCLGVQQARQHGPLGHLVQELVPARHGVNQRAELQVLDQRRLVGRSFPLQVEVLDGMHEQGLHRAMRLLSDR